MADPFTTADKLQAQRLQQALAQARKSLDDGQIDEQAHQGLTQQIQGRLAPLLQRQQQSDQQAKQQQQQDLAQQHAQMEAMNQQAAVYRAQGLHDRIVPVADPVTGKVVRLVEKSPGKWEEIDFSKAPQDEQPQAAPEGE